MMASSVISDSSIIPDPVAHWLSLGGNQEDIKPSFRYCKIGKLQASWYKPEIRQAQGVSM